MYKRQKFLNKLITYQLKTYKSKSMPGADCDSDHVPVMCKLQVKLKKIRKPKAHSKFKGRTTQIKPGDKGTIFY